jgi:hypothetical protein
MDPHFEFMNWEAAFAEFYRRKESDPSLCLVISTGAYVSGYWIESNPKPDPTAFIYRSMAAVRDLESRVRRARAATSAVSLGGLIR